MPDKIPKAWLTTKEAGEYTSTCRGTILRWIGDGLPHARIHTNAIRIKVTDLDEWMERFVNRDEDIEAQLERARVATIKKMKALGIPCNIRPRKRTRS
ncbi:MAG: helix-turn-helix domain-containing protein [Desulfobulbus sp.]